MNMKKLLVTDLDDTLYNWMGFFVPSFFAMVDEVVAITGLDKEKLLDEYRIMHQHYKSVEFPYVTIHLPSVQALYPNHSDEALKGLFAGAFQKFNAVRDQRLHLFPGVGETLKLLHDQGITIVGFSESSQENGFYRSLRLGIADYFTHIYLFESQFRADFTLNPKVRTINSKKPNPELLLQICQQEGFSPEETIYMGDSLTKDVYMAHAAGITSVWANHPEKHPDYVEMLQAVTSWTDEEYAGERARKKEMEEKNIRPDYEVTFYPQLLDIIHSCK